MTDTIAAPQAEARPLDLIDLGPAGRLIGRAAGTIYRWISEGRIRGWKTAGRKQVSRAELLALSRPVEPKGKRAKERLAALPADELTRAQEDAWAAAVIERSRQAR